MSSDRGRREVHYYLKRRDGCGSDLAVIRKEKSSRHMSYRYVISNTSFTMSLYKLRSRREVVDWLNSIVSGLPIQFKELVEIGKSYAFKLSRFTNSEIFSIAWSLFGW
ncbi:hypothetical protein AB3S75_023227 [Citrus x aurantiifolia]